MAGVSLDPVEIKQAGNVVVTLIALGFLLAALAGDQWQKFESDDDSEKISLWKHCVANKTVEICQDLKPKPTYVKVTQAFLIIATSHIFLAAIFSILLVCGKMQAKHAYWPYITTLLSSLIGLAVYSGMADLQDGWEFGWCFILGWLGFAASIAASVRHCIIERSVN